MAAHIDFRLVEAVSLLVDFHDGDAMRQPVAEDMVYRHRHLVTGLAGAEQVNIPLLRQIPGARADVQHVAFHPHDAANAMIAVQPFEGAVGDFEHDPPRIDVTLGEQYL